MQEQETINPFMMWQGSFIPNWLMRRPEVAPSAKLVYGRLCQYAGRDGIAYPALDTLAAEVGVTRRHVCRIINDLETLGLIQRKQQTRDNGASSTNIFSFIKHVWLSGGGVTPMSPRGVTSMSPGGVTSMSPKEVHVLRESKERNINQQPHSRSRTEGHPETDVAGGDGFVDLTQTQNQTLATPEPNPQHPIPVPGHKPAQISTEAYETVSAINGRIGTTGIPQTRHLHQLSLLVAEIGPARVVQIVEEAIDDIQAARNSWPYILGILKNNKTPKPISNKCPECKTAGLLNKTNLKNYKTAANCAARWVGVAHFECPKCKHRQARGETPIANTKPDRAHHEQIRRAVFA